MYVNERFELDDYTIDMLRDMEPPFSSSFGEFIFYRTYSRFIDGRQENWADCVIRVINGIMSIRKDWYVKNHIHWDQKYWKNYSRDLAVSMFKMHWCPPGRGLWIQGTNFIYERGSMALYNCAATDIYFKDLSDDICWIMDSLMLGVGVGFGPIREEGFKFKNPKGSFEYVIPDSREGWVDATKQLIDSYLYGSSKPRFDYREIRPKGLPIKSFGGISSGPEPLKEFHNQLETNIERYMIDKYYDSVLLKADIANQCGCMVVSGNVRRSAELAYGPIGDETFKNLRNTSLYPERIAHYWMSNNAITLKKNKDFDRLGEIANKTINEEDLGYLNLRNFKYGRIGKKDKVRKDYATGINPCTIDSTLVLTFNGLKRVKDLIGQQFITYVNGIPYKSTEEGFFFSGEKEVFELETKEGYKLSCTENHEILAGSDNCALMIPFKWLTPGTIVYLNNHNNVEWDGQGSWEEGYLLGLIYGGGYINREKYGIIEVCEFDHNNINFIVSLMNNCSITKNNKQNKFIITSKELNYLIQKFDIDNKKIINDYILSASSDFQAGFISGFFDSASNIYSNHKNKNRVIRLSQSNYPRLEAIQQILINFGIKSTIYKERDAQIKEYIDKDKNNKVMNCKVQYVLKISNNGINIFKSKIDFQTPNKYNQLKNILNEEFLPQKFQAEVKSIKSIGTHRVYDCQIPGINLFHGNGLILANCGEVPLESGYDKQGNRVRETCNVDETFPTQCTSIEEWYQGSKYACFYCSTVALLPTHQISTNRVVARNRRIGVGIVGVNEWIENEGMSKVIKYLRKGYNLIRETNKILANESGVPESIRVTTVKPSGSVAKLIGKVPGIAYPNFTYMIRRVRVQRNQPMADILKQSNIPFEADYYSKNTDVYSFPLMNNPSLLQAEETSIWQQAMNLVLMQREWADLAVSNTLLYRPKWKLLKSFSIFEGSNDPSASTRKWIIKNSDKYDQEFLLEAMCTLDGDINDQYKLQMKTDEDYEPIEIKIYEYDSRHEEDQIEAVLAAIAPLTKSVSLMPHTFKGIYKQQPEEGITKEEYEKRMSTIRPIDWSQLSNSDGQDERYCTSDLCEIPTQ